MKYPTVVRIPNIEAMREEMTGEFQDFFIHLGGGVKSSKSIRVLPSGRFQVYNDIDGTMQILTDKQLYTRSNIGAAMDAGNFFIN